MIEGVAFILLRDDTFLVEKRLATDTLCPGAVAIPGGTMKEGESHQDTLVREMVEELSIRPLGSEFVCSLDDQALDLTIHFYRVPDWEGEIACSEAEEVYFIPINEYHRLSEDIDRRAMKVMFGI